MLPERLVQTVCPTRFHRQYSVLAIAKVGERLEQFFAPSEDNFKQYPELEAVRKNNDIASSVLLYTEDFLLKLFQPFDEMSSALASWEGVAQNADFVPFSFNPWPVLGSNAPPILLYNKRFDFHICIDVVGKQREQDFERLHVPDARRRIESGVRVAVKKLSKQSPEVMGLLATPFS